MMMWFETMIESARRAGLVLGVSFNRRGRQDVQIVKREVERGNFGTVYHARAFWMRRSGIPGLGTWFTEGYQANKSDQIIAGIIAIFVLALVIDTLIMLIGKALTPWARATGAAAQARPKVEAPA